MAVTRSNLGSAQRAAATSHAITLLVAPEAGTAVVLMIALKIGATGTINSVSGLGATWTRQRSAYVSGSNCRSEIWTATVVTPDTAITITPSTSLAITWCAQKITPDAGQEPVFTILTGADTAGGDSLADTIYTLGNGIQREGFDHFQLGMVSVAATASVTYSNIPADWTQIQGYSGSTSLHPAWFGFGTIPNASMDYTITGSRATRNSFIVIDVGQLPASSTPKSAPDTGAITGTEGVTVAASRAASDSNAITGTEGATVAASRTASDSNAISGPESAAIAAQVTGADSGAIGASEAANLAPVALSAIDSGQVNAAEVAGVAATTPQSASDSGTLGAIEGILLDKTVQAADSALLSGSDTATTGVPVTLGDTATLVATEAAATTATLSWGESAALVATEESVSAASLSVADSGAITASEHLDVGENEIPKLAIDSGVLAVSEQMVASVSLAPADSGVLALTDSAATAASIAAPDTAILGSDEQAALRDDREVIAADSAVLVAVLVAAINAATPVTDTGAIQGTETATLGDMTITHILLADGALLSITERAIPMGLNTADAAGAVVPVLFSGGIPQSARGSLVTSGESYPPGSIVARPTPEFGNGD